MGMQQQLDEDATAGSHQQRKPSKPAALDVMPVSIATARTVCTGQSVVASRNDKP
jgi:hypothetical protein